MLVMGEHSIPRIRTGKVGPGQESQFGLLETVKQCALYMSDKHQNDSREPSRQRLQRQGRLGTYRVGTLGMRTKTVMPHVVCRTSIHVRVVYS